MSYNLDFKQVIFIKKYVLFLLISLLFISGCENSPSDIGLNYIPGDTIGTKILDSQTDSMLVTGSNVTKYTNNYFSNYLAVGWYQNTQSKFLLRFKDITTGYDSAQVVSAKLYLKNSRYAHQDSNGTASFNIYRVSNLFDYTAVTFDKFSSSDIGNTVLGNYNLNAADSNYISVTLDNQTVKDWLKYAVDTNYALKNYGIAFIPNSSSTTIRSFFSSRTADSSKPYMKVIVTKNSITDTLTLNSSESVFLSSAPVSAPADRFVLQSGISIREMLKFDLAKLPPKVIINEALLVLKLDQANSFITGYSDKRLNVSLLTDTAQQTNDGNYVQAYQADSVTWTVRINLFVQKWNLNIYPNLGILIQNFSEIQNLDRFVFYSSTNPDAGKRPRLTIRYTPRN